MEPDPGHSIGMSSGGDFPIGLVLLAFPLFFALLGTAFVVVAIRGIRGTRRFEELAARVAGQCVDLKLHTTYNASGESNSTWHPVLAFTTLDGRSMVVESPWGSIPAPSRPGRPVTVLYDPGWPQRARVDSWHGRMTPFYVLMIVMGGLFALLGWSILLAVAYAKLT